MDAPPLFQPAHTIELTSVDDSKITGVSVYTGRAEVTRLFTFEVQMGQNQVIINGLPDALDQGSLRVEGRGTATIHDVTISQIPEPTTPLASPALKALQAKKQRTLKALQRCKKSIESVEAYLATLHVQHIDIAKLGEVVANYETTTEKLDERLLELEQKREEIEEEIAVESKKLWETTVDNEARLRVAIGVFADLEGEVEIVLIYAVHGASWDALYDIRIDMQAKEEQVKLIYKAAIKQDTGEDWTNVPMTLETATPTFGLGLPILHPWNLSIFKPQPPPLPPTVSYSNPGVAPWQYPGAPVIIPSRSYSSSSTEAPMIPAHRDRHHKRKAPFLRKVAVPSKGNISATFEVPGLLTIPSDGVAHNVTITQLHLNATMSWVCIPKMDARMHLNAKIKNASEYTLLQGDASVYVDGSFISKTSLPPVSAGEIFDCSLGLDPSIRVTYHPRITKASKSGFYNKSNTRALSQTITLFNTKSTPAHNIKVIEQIPVSQDSAIAVKLINPGLPTDPMSEKDIQVSPGVVARWHGANEQGTDVPLLGKDGKLNWVCSIPPQTKLNLVLQWEVSAPTGADIMGLQDVIHPHGFKP